MVENAAKVAEHSPSTSPANTHLWRIARAFALLVIVALGQSAHADEIDRYIKQEGKLYGLPAVVLGVTRDGKLIDARAIGYANVELNVKARPQQAFEVGSI
jgi:CubicO group peptidase (beta-lactamase class C family)